MIGLLGSFAVLTKNESTLESGHPTFLLTYIISETSVAVSFAADLYVVFCFLLEQLHSYNAKPGEIVPDGPALFFEATG